MWVVRTTTLSLGAPAAGFWPSAVKRIRLMLCDRKVRIYISDAYSLAYIFGVLMAYPIRNIAHAA
jgi:hypothetical protein